MKKHLFISVVMLCLGVNAFAAGDLTVGGNATINGNLGVGTTSPQAKVDINGSIRINGITFSSVTYVNLDEDVYSAQSNGDPADTCDGNKGAWYTCSASEERTCTDTFHSVIPVYRTVTCYKNGYLTIR